MVRSRHRPPLTTVASGSTRLDWYRDSFRALKRFHEAETFTKESLAQFGIRLLQSGVSPCHATPIAAPSMPTCAGSTMAPFLKPSPSSLSVTVPPNENCAMAVNRLFYRNRRDRY